MVTTNAGNSNANEGRPGYNKGVEGEKKEKRIYTTDNRKNDKPRSDFRRPANGEGRGEYKPRPNNGEGRGEYKSRPNNGEGRGEYRPRPNNGEGRGEYKPRTTGNAGGYERKSNNGGYSNSFNNKGFDKDKDEETPIRRSKPRTESKPKEQTSDKIEIINRIEKEKKAMKKKHNDSKGDSKPNRHIAKPKRSGNIDWTREYENDSYDDDDLDMYL